MKKIANNPRFHALWELLQKQMGEVLSASHMEIEEKEMIDIAEYDILRNFWDSCNKAEQTLKQIEGLIPNPPRTI